MSMKILAIETSCDETSAAVIEAGKYGIKILSNIVSSQIDIHKKYGGVVPEVAARNHIKNIIPVVNEALEQAFKKSPVRKGEIIDLIAVTAGPGLMSSLLIGTLTAETLAYLWNKPLIIINHIEGHIYANWLKQDSIISKPKFPILSLIVSGGHTQLVLMRDHLKYKLLGQTRDDAAGEAFDKVAKLLDLGYPGGPIISEMADNYSLLGKDGTKFELPRPMINSDDFDFSFSGLKTAVLYLVRDFEKKVCHESEVREPRFQRTTGVYKPHLQKEIVSGICVEFQQAVIDVLIHKTIKAAKEFKVKSVLLAGGVAANNELKKQLGEEIHKELPKVSFYVPEQKLCTDNAAMVGAAAYYRYKANSSFAKKPPVRIKVDPNWMI